MRIFLPSSAAQKVYIISLTDKVYKIWTGSSLVSQKIVRGGPRVDQYVWDLHALAEEISDAVQEGFRVVADTDTYWKQVWVEKYTDNSGKSIETLPTFFTVAPFNHRVGSKEVYQAEISYSPLITASETDGSGNAVMNSETKDAELVLYNSVIYPAYPLLFTTSVQNHKHFGPVFVSSARFSVRGEGQLAAVAVAISLQGGKSVLCATKEVTPPDLQTITLTDLPVGNLFGAGEPNPNASTSADDTAVPPTPPDPGNPPPPQTVQDYRHYRTTNAQDCLVYADLFADLPTFLAFMKEKRALETELPQERIVAMDLSMSQTVNFKVTSTKSPRTQANGPRFASITNRVVEGSLTYFSHDSEFTLPDAGSLTMYFGGCYFFPMENVDWQNPTMQVEAVQGGYLHVFPFLARAVSNAVTNGFAESAYGLPVSEFSVGTVINHGN